MTEFDYKNVSLMICTPAYGDVVTVPYMRSMLELMKSLRAKGVRYMHYTLSTESLVTRARNSCVATFLSQKEYSHMIFIDSDIAFEPDSVFRLLRHDVDIVGGVYPKKNLNMKKYVINIEKDSGSSAEQKSLEYVLSIDSKEHRVKNGLLEVKEIGTGFLMIKRSVFEKIIEKEGHKLKYTPLMMTISQSSENFYAFFHTDIDPVTNHYLSEDYFFVKKWINEYDGKVYADIDIPLTHIGTMKFDGSFRTLLSETGK